MDGEGPEKPRPFTVTDLLLCETAFGHVDEVLDLGRGQVGLARPRHFQRSFPPRRRKRWPPACFKRVSRCLLLGW